MCVLQWLVVMRLEIMSRILYFPLQALLVLAPISDTSQIHRMTLAFGVCGRRRRRRQMERMCSLCAKCFILLWLCDGPKQKVERLQRVHESRYRLSPDRHSMHSIDRSNIMAMPMADGRLRTQLIIISRLYFIIFTLYRPCGAHVAWNFSETKPKKNWFIILR